MPAYTKHYEVKQAHLPKILWTASYPEEGRLDANPEFLHA
jgi:hypothetical protein